MFRSGEESASRPLLNTDPATWEGWLNSFLLWASKGTSAPNTFEIFVSRPAVLWIWSRPFFGWSRKKGAAPAPAPALTYINI